MTCSHPWFSGFPPPLLPQAIPQWGQWCAWASTAARSLREVMCPHPVASCGPRMWRDPLLLFICFCSPGPDVPRRTRWKEPQISGQNLRLGGSASQKAARKVSGREELGEDTIESCEWTPSSHGNWACVDRTLSNIPTTLRESRDRPLPRSQTDHSAVHTARAELNRKTRLGTESLLSHCPRTAESVSEANIAC
jgi:hypothetical protein